MANELATRMYIQTCKFHICSLFLCLFKCLCKIQFVFMVFGGAFLVIVGKSTDTACVCVCVIMYFLFLVWTCMLTLTDTIKIQTVHSKSINKHLIRTSHMQSNIKITTHKTNKRFLILLNTSHQIECTIVRGLHNISMLFYTFGIKYLQDLIISISINDSHIANASDGHLKN